MKNILFITILIIGVLIIGCASKQVNVNPASNNTFSLNLDVNWPEKVQRKAPPAVYNVVTMEVVLVDYNYIWDLVSSPDAPEYVQDIGGQLTVSPYYASELASEGGYYGEFDITPGSGNEDGVVVDDLEAKKYVLVLLGSDPSGVYTLSYTTDVAVGGDEGNNIAIDDSQWDDLKFGNDGAIYGYVTDDTTGNPIEGAAVFIDGTEIYTSTDVDGYYEIPGLNPGIYTVVVVRDDYVIKTIPGVYVAE
ncbi:MAG: hypothetical protein C0601_06935 [Candidatus Muiribacterium halophilum]|uniref:Carboxypeptidase regulatory-like domain-containing protein n=1 Tax=Muiribacterium halophilum TaxID=2053465 RepID=A0A2N5ZGC5_MUIH1|nr:MAG: hypothetical protein C0601_06935 [Candidatus Muirbacterium halophilum]